MKNKNIIIVCLSLVSLGFLLSSFFYENNIQKTSIKKNKHQIIAIQEKKNRIDLRVNKEENMEKNSKNLVLYINPNCRYCHKVLEFMQENNIEISVKSTSEETNKEYLLENGGKTQVPCLFVDKQALYESDDIITYIETVCSTK